VRILQRQNRIETERTSLMVKSYQSLVPFCIPLLIQHSWSPGELLPLVGNTQAMVQLEDLQRLLEVCLQLLWLQLP
jgi:hypothetical protein